MDWKKAGAGTLTLMWQIINCDRDSTASDRIKVSSWAE